MYINDILVEKGGDVYAISSHQSVREAALMMTEHNVGAVIVMDRERIAGILTKRNILSTMGQQGEIVAQYRVADLMSSNIITCAPTDSAEHALHVMNHYQICYLPVIEEGKVCGVVSRGDVLNASISAYQFENRLLKRYIQTWPEEHRGGGLKLVVNNKFRQPAENSGALA